MQLRSLHLNGFKSFAEPTDLSFSPGVTAIVGPNGSGKSNIADAVRWVLGEMSRKTLRSKKSEDVIFAGSKLKGGQSMAEVTLTLDNSDNQVPIDAAEVSVTRRLFRNGESVYEINGTQALLRDIQDILIKAGLAQRSYAVIGQGQADEIVKASPSQRKEYFEEAAGIKQFQAKKDQTLRKLEVTRRNLIRVDDLVREIKPRVNSLKRQADRAAKREEIEKEWRSQNLIWFGAEITALDQGASKEVDAAKNITDQRTKLESEIKTLEKETTTKEQSRLEDEREHSHERLINLRKQLADLEGRRTTIKRKRATLQEHGLPSELAGLPKEIAEKEGELERLTRQAKTLVPQVESLRKSITEAEKKSQETASKIQTLRDALQKARPARNIDQTEISKLVKDVRVALDQLFEKIKSTSTVEELPELVRLADQPRQQLDILKSKVDRGLPQDTDKLNTELDKIMESRDELLAGLAKNRAQLASRETEHKFLSRQIEEVQGLVTELKERLAGAKKAGEEGATEANLAHLASELKDIEQKIATDEEQLNSLEQEEITLDEKFQQSLEQERESEGRARELRNQLAKVVEKQAELNVAKGKYDVRREDLIKQAQQTLGADQAKTLERGGAEGKSIEERATLKNKIDQLRKKMDLAGGIDEDVLKEYEETNERYEFLTSQSTDLSQASDKLREVVHELDQKIQTKFNKAIQQMNLEFDKAFKVLFDGGAAKLTTIRAAKKSAVKDELADTEFTEAPTKTTKNKAFEREMAEDEVTEEVDRLRNSLGIAGIDIKATPPGKKLQGVSMLSGGEKALTSIALLSAILATKPSPFVVLDEVDAALDEANSRRFAKIINSLSQKTQFITITHNRETMRKADILYGVTMQRDGISKLLSVKLDEVDETQALANV